MATFRRFEDIQAWQLGRELARQVYAATQRGAFGRDIGLRDQIRRASVSITSNIAEGYGRRSPKDFARFLTMASGSVAEVQSQLYLALDFGYLDADQHAALMSLTHRAAAALRSLTSYLRSALHVSEPGADYSADPSGDTTPEPPNLPTPEPDA